MYTAVCVCVCVCVWGLAAGPLGRPGRYCSVLGSQPGSVSIGGPPQTLEKSDSV